MLLLSRTTPTPLKGSLAETTYLLRGRAEVVKWFNSPTKVFIANFLWLLATALQGHPHYPNLTSYDLLQNEVRGRETAKRLGLIVPMVTRVGAGYIIQEYIQAYVALDYYRGFPSEKRRVLLEYGRRLAKLHQGGFSKGDTRIQNLLVTREGRLVDVDYEMSGRLSEMRRSIDVYVFLHSLSAETGDHREAFFEGYGGRPKEPWPLALALLVGMPLFNIYYDLKTLLQARR